MALLSACATPPPAPARALAEDQQGHTRFESDDGTVIDGVLNFPAGPGPFPAVILLHGCSGPTETVRGWERALLSWGFATFAIDSLRGRGVSEICTKENVAVFHRVLDAYAARRLLITHPRIDGSRIVLMGFSHGASTALRASVQWPEVPRLRSRVDRLPFRAFIVFYPACNLVTGDLSRAVAPIRIHVGELDNWTPARWCVRLADTLRDSDVDIQVTVYKGAHHSFDNSGAPVQTLPRVLNYGECEFRVAQRCRKLGAIAGYSASATLDARQNVRRELGKILDRF